jgi:hypothetical protein
MQIVFDREALTSLRLKNPDLLSAFVCLGLSAGADGVVKMTAPGPLAHVPHKRRAGMVSALIVAGHLERTPGGYLVHGVSSEATDDGQTEDTEPTAAREASHYNTSQSNSEGTDSGQAKDSGSISEEESEARALIELVPIEPWEELSSEADEGATDDGQTENIESTADREAPYNDVSQNNSGWTEDRQTKDSEASREDSILKDVAELARGEQWEDLPPEEGIGAADNGQPEDRELSATREASHCNASQDNRQWTEIGQEGNSSGDDIEALETILDKIAEKTASPLLGLGDLQPAPTVTEDDRALEMAREAWRTVDPHMHQQCDGRFDLFWTYRKQHFLKIAAAS